MAENMELLTMKEAGKLLSVTRMTLYRLHERGLLDFVKIGSAVRISAAEVQRFIRDNSQKGGREQ